MANDPLLNRDWKITYGSLVVGGAASGTNYHLLRKHELDVSHPIAVVEFDVLCTAATDAEYASRAAALVTAFQTPRNRLRIELGSSEVYDFDPSDDSGFNARPSIRKPGSEEDTARSALFRCRVECDLPALLNNARRDSQVTLRTLDTGQRQVEIVGVYTATGGTAARAQYEAQIGTYATSVTTGIDAGATWDQIGPEEAQADDTDKLLRFRRIYEEVLYDETTGGAVAKYKNQRLEIAVRQLAVPGGASDSSAQPPLEVTAAYSVSVDKDTTQDLRTEWASTMLAHVKTQIATALGGGGVTYMEITPVYDWPRNRVRAYVRALSYAGIAIVEQTIERRDYINKGLTFVPLADGREDSYQEYKGSRRHLRTVTRMTIRLVGAGGAEESNVSPVLRLPGRGGGEAGTELAEIQPDEGFRVLTEEVITRGPYFDGIPGSQTELEGLVEIVPMLRVAPAEEEG